jgi:hypothetical protein
MSMAFTINLETIQATMDHLSEKQKGRDALLAFRTAIEELRGALPTSPNDAEFLYVLQRLVGQMRPKDLSAAVATKGGQLSENQLDSVVGGVLTSSSLFSAQGVTKLGDYRTIGNLGFRILANVV